MARHLTRRQKTLILLGCVLFGPVRTSARILAHLHCRWLEEISPNIRIDPDSTFHASWTVQDRSDLSERTVRRIRWWLGLTLFDPEEGDDPDDCN